MKSEKKRCICGEDFLSTQDHCGSCQEKVEAIKLLSTEEKLDALKKLFEEEEAAQLEQLNMFLGCLQFLKSEYILSAIIEKMERDFDDVEIDEHMMAAAEADYDLANTMYAAWQGWW